MPIRRQRSGLIFAPWDSPAFGLRTRFALGRQDRRSAATARRHDALGLLMAAEHPAHLALGACRNDHRTATARIALDITWRALHHGARNTPNWTPGVMHVRQAHDLHHWSLAASEHDVHALLRRARHLAADEFNAARAGRRTGYSPEFVAVPSA